MPGGRPVARVSTQRAADRAYDSWRRTAVGTQVERPVSRVGASTSGGPRIRFMAEHCRVPSPPYRSRIRSAADTRNRARSFRTGALPSPTQHAVQPTPLARAGAGREFGRKLRRSRAIPTRGVLTLIYIIIPPLDGEHPQFAGALPCHCSPHFRRLPAGRLTVDVGPPKAEG
jgi:hypothetical protein